MIAVFGSINADVIFPMTTLPTAGQTLLAHGMRTEAGGKGANQAVAAARDGAVVVMVGAVGRDPLAESALAGLRESGVDLTRVARSDAPTGCAFICTDAEGRNFVVVAPGANATTRAVHVEDSLLTPGLVLLTQMEAKPAETAQLILRSRARGCRVIHNLAPAGELAPEALRAVDILVVNEDEAAWVGRQFGCAGDASTLRDRIGIAVVRTLGGAGVEYSLSHEPTGQPSTVVSARPIIVRDTTAAGDCFVGVLAATLDRGEGFAEAIRRANVAAAIACTRPGSQRSLPARSETDAALAL